LSTILIIGGNELSYYFKKTILIYLEKALRKGHLLFFVEKKGRSVSFQISHYDYRIKSTSDEQYPKGKRGNYLHVEDEWSIINPFGFLIIDESIKRA